MTTVQAVDHRAPYALHHAVTRLRRDHPDLPELWAPYIHFGP
jgi:hypothetical protein